jgi:hypothetical protein
LVVIKLKTSVLQASPEKYKTIEEFYGDMKAYEEIIFEYCERKYIVTYYDTKLSIAECNQQDTEQIFTSLEEFATNFLVDGVQFKDFVTKIDILVR